MSIVKRLPSIFISHGAPNLILDFKDPTRIFLSEFSKKVLGDYEKPKGVVCISAHWEEKEFTITTSQEPKVIYDFYGFEPEMYKLEYPAKTTTEMISDIKDEFTKAKVTLREDSSRGFDHGCWMPLKLIYPNAEVPVVQLSLKSNLDARDHIELGRILKPLRDKGYLLLSSGGSVHNLRAIFDPKSNQDPSWAIKFEDWLKSTLTDKTGPERTKELLNYQSLPFTQMAHPRTEHLVPIFVACGAGGEDSTGKRIYDYFKTPVFSVSSYQFSN